jgi:hypothetical protein
VRGRGGGRGARAGGRGRGARWRGLQSPAAHSRAARCRPPPRSLDDAIDAQKRTHQATFNGRTITVEFVQGRGADGGGYGSGGGGYGGGRDYDRDRGGGGGGRDRSRSRSPPRRRRSPSYDMGDRRERGRDGASPAPRREASPPRRERSPPRRERSRSMDRMADRDEPRRRSRSRSPR